MHTTDSHRFAPAPGLLPLTTILVLLATSACQRETNTPKDLADKWWKGMQEHKRAKTDEEQALAYFQRKWLSISNEIVAERALKSHLGLRDDALVPIQTGFPYSAEHQLAREVFYDKFGFYPPDTISPVAVDEMGAIVPVAMRAAIDVEWLKTLRSEGLIQTSKITDHLRQWSAIRVQQKAQAEKVKIAAAKYGLRDPEAGRFVIILEILKTLYPVSQPKRGSSPAPYVKMRNIPDIKWLDVLEQLEFVESTVIDTEIHWRLTSKGIDSARTQTIEELAISAARSERYARSWLPGPLILGRYRGLAVVQSSEWKEGPNLNKDNPEGNATGQHLIVKVTHGAVYVTQVHYAGEVVGDIYSMGSTRILGKPMVNERVGYRHDGNQHVWEAIR